jgi:hypothetical protein
MAMKINGIPGALVVPNINKRKYRYAKFDATLKATVNTVLRTVNVQSALESAWAAVVQRSKTKSCNECFKKLVRKKSLAEILAEGDVVLHLLEPKEGSTDADLPDANAAGRDIGLHPWLFFDSDALALPCTLIHELAHVGGASTDPGAAPDVAHAAERTLLSCGCNSKYRAGVLGSIQFIRSVGTGGSRLA